MHPDLVTIDKAALNRDYQRRGILLQDNVLTVDLAEPRTVLVKGINSRTGQEKDYLLRITEAGKLSLV